MFGEMEGGARSRGGQISQWRTELLGDMTDFGWIEKKGEGVSATDWEKYKAKVWKEKLAVMATKPEDWNAALSSGEYKFMSEWHEKEELESKERRKKRTTELTRLRTIVWGGWYPRTEDMKGWEDFEAKWSRVRRCKELCKEVRERRILELEEKYELEIEELVRQGLQLGLL